MDSDDDWMGELPELVRAAATGDVEEVARLLDGGTDPNQADENGWSALHAAAVRDHLDAVDLLLKRGAEVNRRDAEGFTPLLTAAGRASESVIELLIRTGAEVDVVDPRYSWTPLSRAAEHANAGAMRALLRVDASVEGGASYSTPLMDAAEAGSLECVELLLRAGADPTRVIDGDDAASLARRHGHHEVAQRLDAARASRGDPSQ